jgi:hypothetical protein
MSKLAGHLDARYASQSSTRSVPSAVAPLTYAVAVFKRTLHIDCRQCEEMEAALRRHESRSRSR